MTRELIMKYFLSLALAIITIASSSALTDKELRQLLNKIPKDPPAISFTTVDGQLVPRFEPAGAENHPELRFTNPPRCPSSAAFQSKLSNKKIILSYVVIAVQVGLFLYTSPIGKYIRKGISWGWQKLMNLVRKPAQETQEATQTLQPNGLQEATHNSQATVQETA